MAFIISSNTTITFGGISTGLLSVTVNSVPTIEPLYVIGSTSPFSEIRRLQVNINITRLGGGPIYTTEESPECVDANTIAFSITPGSCTGIGEEGSSGVSGDFFVSSYSFQKEVYQYGRESWNLVGKPEVTFRGGSTAGGDQIVMLRGTALGSTSEGLTGVILDPTGLGFGDAINISAGNPGIGKSNTIVAGIVTQVGGSNTTNDSSDCQAQASIPYSPITLEA